jgi:hypothetical protein
MYQAKQALTGLYSVFIAWNIHGQCLFERKTCQGCPNSDAWIDIGFVLHKYRAVFMAHIYQVPVFEDVGGLFYHSLQGMQAIWPVFFVFSFFG